MSIEPYIVEHCSPTLASLKTANLFSIGFENYDELLDNVERNNKMLNPKGVYVELLTVKDGRALVYVYRKVSLENDLRQPVVKEILSSFGYREFEISKCVDVLRKRLYECDGFPHEIGLFLGYPPGDVKGFIVNGGRNFKCTGCWKVYCDEAESRKCFGRFKKCKDVYRRLFNEGRTIVSLTVNF